MIPDIEPDNPIVEKAVSKTEKAGLQGDERHPGSALAAPMLSIDSIQTPAMLVDDQLRIVWQNQLAIDKIWHRAGPINNGNRFPRLFDLLFDSQYQQHVKNWRKWVDFFIQEALELMPADNLRIHVERMTERQKDVIMTLMSRMSAPEKRHFSRSRLRQALNDGNMVAYDILAVDFNEGRLMLFEPQKRAKGVGHQLTSLDIEARIEQLRRHPSPVKQSFSMMAANLDNSFKLNMEMLSDEYSGLVHALCQRSMETIERHGGIFNNHLESGFYAYFLDLDEADGNAMRAISCCLELKDEIAELSREWKIRKSWSHDIDLNMGLHRAYEHVGILNAHGGESVVSSGSALNMVTNISNWARGGQIWATKSIFKEMHPDTYKQIRFGVMRPDGKHRQGFIHRCFSAVSDLPGLAEGALDTGGELEGMAVTQIFDRQV